MKAKYLRNCRVKLLRAPTLVWLDPAENTRPGTSDSSAENKDAGNDLEDRFKKLKRTTLVILLSCESDAHVELISDGSRFRVESKYVRPLVSSAELLFMLHEANNDIDLATGRVLQAFESGEINPVKGWNLPEDMRTFSKAVRKYNYR